MMTDAAESGGNVPDRSLETRSTVDLLEAMRDSADRIKDREISEAITRLDARSDVTAEQREEIQRLADRLVHSLLAPPASALRAADDEQVRHTAVRLFDPSGTEVNSDD